MYKEFPPFEQVPDSVENVRFFESLSRFPNVVTNRFIVSATAYADLRIRMQEIAQALGRNPNIAVLCHSGLYRSRVIARKLAEDRLVQITIPNWNLDTGEIKGISADEISFSLDVDEEGGVVYRDEPSDPIDALILTLGNGEQRFNDRRDLTAVSRYIDRKMGATAQSKPVHLIWVDGTEDDLDIWFPELAPKK